MASRYDEGPEVHMAPHSYPEVSPHQYQQTAPTPYGHVQEAVKHEPSPYPAYGQADPSVYGTSTTHAPSPYSRTIEPAKPEGEKSSRGTICGCTLLVFVLSIIIGMLAAAVIGLAAGTGIEANRINELNDKVAQLSSSLTSGGGATKTVTLPQSTSTATALDGSLDNNCSIDPTNVSGQAHTTFKLLLQQTFTMYCNKDAPGTKLMSLFTSDFNTCMDACSSWNMYEAPRWANAQNSTCGGVSFIPIWTNREVAQQGDAPGNCYLKPSPQNSTSLDDPKIGTKCHAAILTGL